ncbi:hypothetical protein BH18THE2_BH18THE2_26260 [soil metagenome]
MTTACRQLDASAIGEKVMTPPMTMTLPVARITSPCPSPPK